MRLTHTTGLALALPLLTAACAVSTQAQSLSLQSGDNVTVNGTGTTGTYQGMPINNSTSTYQSGDNPVIDVPANSAFTLGAGGSVDAMHDGIDETNGTVNINGGSVTNGYYQAIYAHGGTVNVTSGTISGFEGLYTNNATVNISGGTFSGLLGADIEGGTADVTGGAFTGGPGGTDFNVSYGPSSTPGIATISGGSFAGSPGAGHDITAGNGGTIDLLGTFSQTAPIYDTGSNAINGLITGTLLDGQAINVPYDVNPGGEIEFNGKTSPVPEASTMVSFGLLLGLGLGGLVFNARRRKAQTAE